MLVGENDCAFVVGCLWALPAWKRCIWHGVPQELWCWTPKKKLEAKQWLLNCDGAGALKTAETFTIALTGLHLTPATRSSPCAILSNKHTCKEQTLPSGCAQERCQPCYALSNLLNNGIILALRADILWIN